jgi:hypothetical protein
VIDPLLSELLKEFQRFRPDDKNPRGASHQRDSSGGHKHNADSNT